MPDGQQIVPVDFNVHESKVTYSTKEILAAIYARFDHLETIAEGSATRIQVETVIGRVSALEQDASGTKAVATALLASGKDRWSKNEKVAGLVFASMALAPSLIAIINLFN